MRLIFIVFSASSVLTGCARNHEAKPAAVAGVVKLPSKAIDSTLGGCVKAICPFAAADLARPRTPGHAERVQRDLDVQLKPLIEEEIEVAASSHAVRDLVDLFPRVSLSGVVLDEDTRVLLNLFLVLNTLNFLERAGLTYPNAVSGQTDFDHAAALKFLRQHPRYADADEVLLTAVGQIANAIGYRLMDLQNNLTISFLYRQVTPKVTYQRFITETFKDLKLVEARIFKLFPYLERPKSPLVRRFEAGQVISDEDSSELVGEMAMYGLIDEALTDEPKRAALLNLKPNYVANAEQAWRDIKTRNQNNLAWPREAVREHCLKKYGEKLSTFPTTEEIRAFDHDERVPTQSVAVAALREIGLTEGATALVSAGVHYPAPYGLAVRRLVTDLTDDVKFRRLQIVRLQRLRDRVQANQSQALGTMLALFASHAIDDPQEINVIYGACDAVRPADPVDSTFATDIAVSWQVLLRHVSVLTLAHEMGHAAYFAYAEDKRPALLRDQLACLSRRHQGLDAHPEMYQSEDFADLVGNEVARRLGDRRTTSLCEYVTEGFARLAQAPENRDPHSATFFRLLTFENPNVPPRCEAVVRDSGAVNFAESCWRPAASAPGEEPNPGQSGQAGQPEQQPHQPEQRAHEDQQPQRGGPAQRDVAARGFRMLVHRHQRQYGDRDHHGIK